MSDPRLILFEALKPFLSQESQRQVQVNADIIDQRLAAGGYMRSLYSDREKLKAEKVEMRKVLSLALSLIADILKGKPVDELVETLEQMQQITLKLEGAGIDV